MSIIIRLLLAILLGYLLGSVPPGYLIGRLFGVDVRQHGSGRTGGTNVWRAAGLTPAILTVLMDGLKGILTVLIARHFLGGEWAAALGGAAAVFGHNWSCFLNFRGGAGGITGGAVILTLNWRIGIFVALLAILLLYLTHYASVGTMTVGVGTFLVALTGYLLGWRWVPLPHVIYGALATIWIVVSLLPNIKQLIRGEERRITLW